MKVLKGIVLTLILVLMLFGVLKGKSAQAQNPAPVVGERPALEQHVNQTDIDREGRPAATGAGTPTRRDPSHNPGFIRTSGTDSNSCADCHNTPTVGGAGGFVANVFVLAQTLDPVTDSVSAEFSDERNTLGMNGSGAIDMLAREMTTDLLAVRDATKAQAKASGAPATRSLDTKGVNFGQIAAGPDGSVDTSRVQGVDTDLIIKPFHQKGVVNSVRVFTVNAFNHHHGMEAVERFGIGQLDSLGNMITTNDFDQDGVPDELSIGDITAATIFQVAMNIPGRVISDDPSRRAAATRGETSFASIGCTDCHKPALTLIAASYSEPNPYNPAGNLRVQDVPHPFTFDLTRDIPKPRLEPAPGGGATVRAYTDLKRHVIADDQDPYFRNERLIQNGVPVDQFITRKLWDGGNKGHYGHRGDLTTLTDAILHHAGEARPHRERFAALSKDQQAEIIEFLKQLQVLPNGSSRDVTESELSKLLKSQKTVKPSLVLNQRPSP
jgi:hypothetical protein